jgi:hypothetical protein
MKAQDQILFLQQKKRPTCNKREPRKIAEMIWLWGLQDVLTRNMFNFIGFILSQLSS